MRYHKRPRPEPSDEWFLVLVILLGPIAWPMRWLWRGLRAVLAEVDENGNSAMDSIRELAATHQSRPRCLLTPQGTPSSLPPPWR